MEMNRKDLLAVALVLFDDLAPWDRDGLTKTDLRRANKDSLNSFIDTMYRVRRSEMWYGDFEIWWRSVLISAGVWKE